VQLDQQRQPVQVGVAVPAPAVTAALDGREQADPLVPAQGVRGKPALSAASPMLQVVTFLSL
jgi:hypothetical protein